MINSKQVFSSGPMGNHEFWMRKALKLAEKGRGWTSPNPVVGAVLVKDETEISSGYHKKYGEPHAEVIAISNAGEKAQGATLYVNLEPCCIHGKTPPCTEAIIKAGIKKVIIGTIDPNPMVNGKGIETLREHGIEVLTGVLEEECRKINRGFFKYITTGLPWITLKLALTVDGFIADVSGNSKWISSRVSRNYVKRRRQNFDSIMVGIGTVMKDNPKLLPLEKSGYIPYRIVIDELLNIPINHNLVSDEYRNRTIIITCNTKKAEKIKHLTNRGIRVLQSASTEFGWVDIKAALKDLAKIGITSIFCEGGSQIAGSLIDKQLIDELEIFYSPKIIGKGINAFSGFYKTIEHPINIKWNHVEQSDEDIHLIGELSSCSPD